MEKVGYGDIVITDTGKMFAIVEDCIGDAPFHVFALDLDNHEIRIRAESLDGILDEIETDTSEKIWSIEKEGFKKRLNLLL
jgi:hypothetical protein